MAVRPLGAWSTVKTLCTTMQTYEELDYLLLQYELTKLIQVFSSVMSSDRL